MIADYKFYHGAVLAELVTLRGGALSINGQKDDGRLSCYILNDAVGMQIKHSTNRLHPWQFTFTETNFAQLAALRRNYKEVFVVLVCRADGIVALTLEEVKRILAGGDSEQAWIRVDRRKNELYSISGCGAELSSKRPHGVHRIIEALHTAG